ncbi:MAG: SsrA-binding protein SmpB [Calditrichaeota bacterium]|nr:SsrA-binding protein SmpB [Candidatus Cloacimonadota bacterium]MCA9786526.1 SsrA-binding protein SmpB [Candidatus Cloacimonadota bacterium]MCB1045581.1 SsrA-binding protein SmpB [Calditrichota bacterium]MCB9473274.1 SsrA-binding protein SmpB [Candidatus Delongbacteria bacterium]
MSKASSKTAARAGVRTPGKARPVERIIVQNRKARHDYHILDTWEAGIALCGTEVKACREGGVSLKEAYARVIDGEVWILGMRINPYSNGRFGAHVELRQRKLLLHAAEIRKISHKVEAKGNTLVPLSLYWKSHLVKVRLALGTGKHEYDKRQAITDRENARSLSRALKESRQR